MSIIEGNHLKGWQMLPAKKGTCEECATAHQPELPHNASSMFYQYKFYNEHGRWPNWEDAMAHCDEDMQKYWRKSLLTQGVDVSKGEVFPRSKKQ